MEDLIVITKFECLRPRKLTEISQHTNVKQKLDVEVPRYGQWEFNTATHVMIKRPKSVQEFAKTLLKLRKHNIWHKVAKAY